MNTGDQGPQSKKCPRVSHLGWDPLLSVFKTKQKQDGKKRRYVDHCDHGSNIRGTSHSLQ